MLERIDQTPHSLRVVQPTLITVGTLVLLTVLGLLVALLAARRPPPAARRGNIDALPRHKR